MNTQSGIFEIERKSRSLFQAIAGKKQRTETYSGEVISGGLEAIEKIADEWAALCDEGYSNRPFLRPKWFLAFVKNFPVDVQLFTARKNGRLRAVLPLMRVKETLHGIPVSKLKSIFNSQTPHFDMIHGDDESERDDVVNCIWNVIKTQRNWNIFEVRLVRTDSWINDLLKIAELDEHKTGLWKMEFSPITELPQGTEKAELIDSFQKSLSKNKRQSLKKQRKYLDEFGKAEFTVSRNFSEELMSRYFALEASGWKGRNGTASAADEREKNLLSDFAKAVANKNALAFHELKLNGETIAMYITIKYAEKTVGWKMSYNEKYARCSPGNLLILEVLKDCIKTDSTELDHLYPITYFKQQWSTCEREKVAYFVFQKGILGSLLWTWKFAVVNYLRRFKKR